MCLSLRGNSQTGNPQPNRIRNSRRTGGNSSAVPVMVGGGDSGGGGEGLEKANDLDSGRLRKEERRTVAT